MDQERATDALLAVSRTMTAVVARTLAEVPEDVSVPQLRVLVLLWTRGSMNVSTLARHLGVDVSNASRTCDRLEASHLVARRPDEQDRRTVGIVLTGSGSAFVDDLMRSRRALLEDVVSRMSPEQQRTLAEGLEAFAAVVSPGLGDVDADPGDVTVEDGRWLPWSM